MINSKSSQEIARQRLVSVLYNDRTKDLLDKDIVNLLKYDTYRIISKYFVIDEDNIELSIESQNNDIYKNICGVKISISIDIDNILNCVRKVSND